VSATDHHWTEQMSRRQRQLDELTALCRRGAVARAIDLAFEHVAMFGTDDDLIRLLRDTIVRPGVPERVRRRFTELDDATR
jgi:hypothetical protein